MDVEIKIRGNRADCEQVFQNIFKTMKVVEASQWVIDEGYDTNDEYAMGTMYVNLK